MASEIEVIGWAARDTLGHMAPITFSRRALGPRDVKFFIKFCGVCHSDWTVISGEVYNPTFPVVPGHEIVGVVDEVGSEVTKFKVGDHAAVSAYVNSCGSCRDCERKLPQHCKGKVRVYDSVNPADGLRTYGGYSNLMVVDESFCLVLPKNLPLDGAAPLLCAGATVWSPMKRYGMGKNGDRFGVVGLGGLGHIALKFAKALGMHATVISTSPAKEKMAREELGADNFIVSKDTKQMEEAAGTLDFIIDTVSGIHPLDPLMNLLAPQGKFIFVGVGLGKLQIDSLPMCFGGTSIGSSCIASQEELQEMLDFCGEKNLVCTIEKIPIDYINEAFKRMLKGDVHFRFVIDVGNTLKPQN
ncbi:hypothetical protein MPTK1_5g14650 [Marchantia polymorpha subsp. ruderalis]|uniref:Enoyl reductase (ER) domain-containing protein n=2 Tax=Marchantia polymorpha TaxID=3197 RepID=A0AAF6BIE3_MARPO|nr:hypothetical protein MARPO_0032s0157 [Marchantia polymorpha]BBN11777.1 hypothetical protein Mp_5g14650 [Marchantia polymorpha subsp. ruderalis]|eukprot:PTQ41995.1 hypothetical protein MARPO_0032s0157 [Marchantia polymorpha]